MQPPYRIPAIGQVRGASEEGFDVSEYCYQCCQCMMNDMNSDNYWKNLLRLDHKSAVVARGIVEHFDATDLERTKLKACQIAATEFGKELGVDISPSLCGKIGRLQRDAGVFLQFSGKTKKGYILEPGPRLDEFREFLNTHSEYGLMITKSSIDKTKTRAEVIEAIDELGGIMLDGDAHRLPRAQFGALHELLNEGRLKAIYVRPSTKVAVKAKDDNKAHPIDFWYGDDE